MLTLNIGSKSKDWRAQRLSNFSADSFVIDGIRFASVEGFIQGTKFPTNDPRREQAFQSVGRTAKRFGKNAERKFIWWRSGVLSYGSQAHHRLIEKAIRAKFEQNSEALEALIATRGMTLVHDLGHPESPNTSLPAKVFCDILTRIREKHCSTQAR
ncbi:MAG: hypothetical protein HYT93_04165 [Parcubacteria group bacterium]|nr:hypothetical protein [Parcubacteria group bacterium]